MGNIKIKIKYLDEKINDEMKLSKISIGDWIDLRSAENVEIKSGGYRLIRLGVAIELPDGYEAYLVPRSSTFKKFGVIQSNSIGVIDNSYRGEWCMPVIAMRDTVIHQGDRICQFRIVKNQPEIEFIEVESLSDSDRGAGGFGSTGV